VNLLLYPYFFDFIKQRHLLPYGSDFLEKFIILLNLRVSNALKIKLNELTLDFFYQQKTILYYLKVSLSAVLV
jgi:hypothetical protein